MRANREHVPGPLSSLLHHSPTHALLRPPAPLAPFRLRVKGCAAPDSLAAELGKVYIRGRKCKEFVWVSGRGEAAALRA